MASNSSFTRMAICSDNATLKNLRGVIPTISTPFEREDLFRMLETVAETNRGRLPQLAGLIVYSTEEAIIRGRMVPELCAHGLQVTPLRYRLRPDEEATLAHFHAVAEGTGLPMLIYIFIPYNYLSPALLLRIMREVPGLVSVQWGADDLKLLADFILQARPQDVIFAAIDALLYPPNSQKGFLAAEGPLTA